MRTSRAVGRRVALAGLALMVAFAAAAQSQVAGDDPRCDLSAWSGDDDPAGLNIRSGPSTSHAVIAVLPAPASVDGEAVRAELELRSSRDGWFLVTRATVPDYANQSDDRVVFEGQGWVSGARLGLLLNQSYLRDAPSDQARVVGELLDGEGNGPDSFAVERLHACVGRWVEVEGSFSGRRYRGWAAGTCSNQVTTCP